jgi:hypothetical protein
MAWITSWGSSASVGMADRVSVRTGLQLSAPAAAALASGRAQLLSFGVARPVTAGLSLEEPSETHHGRRSACGSWGHVLRVMRVVTQSGFRPAEATRGKTYLLQNTQNAHEKQPRPPADISGRDDLRPTESDARRARVHNPSNATRCPHHPTRSHDRTTRLVRSATGTSSHDAQWPEQRAAELTPCRSRFSRLCTAKAACAARAPRRSPT